jgi:hypothetical protein
VRHLPPLVEDAGVDAGGAETDGSRHRTAIVPDAEIVTALIGMGFSLNGASRAAIGVRNRGVEEAVEYCFEHNGDANFNDPIPEEEEEQQQQQEAEEPSQELLRSAASVDRDLRHAQEREQLLGLASTSSRSTSAGQAPAAQSGAADVEEAQSAGDDGMTAPGPLAMESGDTGPCGSDGGTAAAGDVSVGDGGDGSGDDDDDDDAGTGQPPEQTVATPPAAAVTVSSAGGSGALGPTPAYPAPVPPANTYTAPETGTLPDTTTACTDTTASTDATGKETALPSGRGVVESAVDEPAPSSSTSALAQLLELGLGPEQDCIRALQYANGSVEAAAAALLNRGGASDAIVPPLPAERLDRPHTRPRGKHQLLDSQRNQLHDCIRQLVQKSAGTARPNWAQNMAVLRASEGGDEAAAAYEGRVALVVSVMTAPHIIHPARHLCLRNGYRAQVSRITEVLVLLLHKGITLAKDSQRSGGGGVTRTGNEVTVDAREDISLQQFIDLVNKSLGEKKGAWAVPFH